jgi:hypothetical protein
MKRIATDTMVLDLIADTPGLLAGVRVAVSRGALKLLVTHLGHDQTTAIPDTARRSKLIAVWNALPTTTLATRRGVLGLPRLDEFQLRDGTESGVLASDVRPSAKIGGAAGALIAIIASGDAEILATGDVRLRAKAMKAGVACEAWSLDQFVAFVKDRAK